MSYTLFPFLYFEKSHPEIWSNFEISAQFFYTMLNFEILKISF